jgi:hypothetical protein
MAIWLTSTGIGALIVATIYWIAFHVHRRRPKCPNCWRRDDVSRARLRVREYVLLAFLLRPYRCACCALRFYRPVWRGRPPEKKPVDEQTGKTAS